MPNYLNSVKIDSILKVVHELCIDCDLSVSYLCERTGLSSFTILKILKLLTEMDFVSHTKSKILKNEMKLNHFYIKNSYNAIAVDLSSETFDMYVVKPGRRVRKIYHYGYDNSMSFEENIDSFIKNSKYSCRKTSISRNTGTYVVLPSSTDVTGTKILSPIYDDTNDTPLPDIIRKLTYSKVASYEDYRISHVRSIQKMMSNDDLALVLFLDKTRFSSCIFANNTENIKISNLGEQYKTNNIKFIDNVMDLQSPNETVETFAQIISNMHNALAFTHVYLLGNYIPHMNLLVDMIRDRVNTDIPSLIFPPYMKTEQLLEFPLQSMIYNHIKGIILDKQVDK